MIQKRQPKKPGEEAVHTASAADDPSAVANSAEAPKHEIPTVIGEFLQAHYRDLVDAPVPDHLVRLVEMLEQREAGKKPAPLSDDESGPAA